MLLPKVGMRKALLPWEMSMREKLSQNLGRENEQQLRADSS